jgi:NADH-quinone oxidoreductase subunit M
LFFIILLSLLALPGTNLFVGEFLILLGAFEASWVYALIGVIGVILGAAYLLWWFERSLFAPAPSPHPAAVQSAPGDLTRLELAVALPLVLLIFWVGLYPAPFLRVINPSIAAVAQRIQEAAPVTASLEQPDHLRTVAVGNEERP